MSDPVKLKLVGAKKEEKPKERITAIQAYKKAYDLVNNLEELLDEAIGLEDQARDIVFAEEERAQKLMASKLASLETEEKKDG